MNLTRRPVAPGRNSACFQPNDLAAAETLTKSSEFQRRLANARLQRELIIANRTREAALRDAARNRRLQREFAAMNGELSAQLNSAAERTLGASPGVPTAAPQEPAVDSATLMEIDPEEDQTIATAKAGDEMSSDAPSQSFSVPDKVLAVASGSSVAEFDDDPVRGGSHLPHAGVDLSAEARRNARLLFREKLIGTFHWAWRGLSRRATALSRTIFPHWSFPSEAPAFLSRRGSHELRSTEIVGAAAWQVRSLAVYEAFIAWGARSRLGLSTWIASATSLARGQREGAIRWPVRRRAAPVSFADVPERHRFAALCLTGLLAVVMIALVAVPGPRLTPDTGQIASDPALEKTVVALDGPTAIPALDQLAATPLVEQSEPELPLADAFDIQLAQLETRLTSITTTAWVPATRFSDRGETVVARGEFTPGGLPNSKIVDGQTPKLVPATQATRLTADAAAPTNVSLEPEPESQPGSQKVRPTALPESPYAALHSLRPLPRP